MTNIQLKKVLDYVRTDELLDYHLNENHAT